MDGINFEPAGFVNIWKEFYPDIPQLLDVLPALWTSGDDNVVLKEGLFKRSSKVSATIKSNVLILNKDATGKRKKSIVSSDIISVNESKKSNRLKIKFKRTSSSSKNLSLQFENSETCDAWKAKIEQLMTADKPSLDQYTEPLRFLNDGAYGSVFHCKRLKDDKDVAIKEIPVKNLQHINMLNQERSALERVLSFASPFVLPMLSSFRAFSGNLYFVMPLMQTDLHKVLITHGKFQENEVQFYMAEIISGLKAVHNAGLVHRDLKLENILVNEDGHIRICDFGLAKFLGDDDNDNNNEGEEIGNSRDGVAVGKRKDGGESKKRSDTFCGTTTYLSPEMLNVKEWGVGKSSDFWQVGIIMYELLTKKSPFKRKAGGTEATYAAIRNVNPKMPDELSEAGKNFLGGLIEKNFWNRLGENGGIEEIQAHDFFKNIHWDDVVNEKLIAPFYPSEMKKMGYNENGKKANKDNKEEKEDERLEFGRIRGVKKYAKAFKGFDFVSSTNSANDIAAIEDVTDFRFPHDKKVSGEVSKTNSSEAHPLSLQF